MCIEFEKIIYLEIQRIYYMSLNLFFLQNMERSFARTYYFKKNPSAVMSAFKITLKYARNCAQKRYLE